ncbi:hypothetical protein DBB36_02130 [Flavobacterium sp. WLB]|uniref:leucine-rich repeat protein n=1 Tax=unclassified Flavobacterium TaxID=196869 RepID=UPI0006ABD10E|nr:MULTISPECIES: leucine-rich repeat protein [unclassified Flavobacterium]KOP39225.1 hypothetical protein AKO67_06690 [Flavobacterium sp. VMW]OWU89111.1 hypothetical protein APR43_18065 [Flavobacterium sp. NLM]PUU71678.1 hypothetical protein DBB36_02130 [Flavobacterium sp. WLB]
MSSLLQNTVFGNTKNKPNTFIGGVSSTINTPALIAGKLGISSNRINNFKIKGADIEFTITGGKYEIASNAFYGDTSLTFFNDRFGLVTRINLNAFYNCTNYTGDVSFPSVTRVDSQAFSGTRISSFYFPALTTCAGGLEFSNNSSLISFDAPILISLTSTGTFRSCTNLVTVYAPLLILTVTNSTVFRYCSNLLNLTIGKPTGIGNNAFEGAEKLLFIDLSNATIISPIAFSGCTLLKDIVDLNKVTSLGDECFLNCISLEIVVNVNSLTTITGNSFLNCEKVLGYNFNSLRTITGGSGFTGNLAVNFIYMPLLNQLGATTANNGIFSLIKTDAVITVSPYLKTVNAGTPDGDLLYASGTRNAIVIYANYIIAGVYGSSYQRSVNEGSTFFNGGFATSARGVSISETTKYITFATNSNVMVSSDFGQTFTVASLPSTVYYCASMSKDGQYQLVTQSAGHTYRSVDYGTTWELAVSGGRRDCFVSRTGQYQLTTNIDAPNITISTDYGANWSTITGLGTITALCCSDDGQYITAVGSGSTIKVSTNGGLTWITKTAYGNFTLPKVAMSSDGKYQTVIGSNKYIYISSDYGASWTSNTNTLNNVYYSCLDMSKDGKIQATAVPNGYIYISLDYGLTWNQKGDILNYQAISISG